MTTHQDDVGDAARTAEEAVLSAERAEIFGADAAQRDPQGATPTWGLALSGGGIRSATFALGMLQFLARERLLPCFHYLSTVSGGGYIGAFVQGLIRRHGFAHAFEVLASHAGGRAQRERDATPGAYDADLNKPVRHLREYSNYLSPRKSALSGDTLGLVGTFVRNVILIQLQLCALMLALSVLPLALYPLLNACLIGNPVMALSASGLLAMLAALLIAYIGVSARRERANAMDAETPRRRVVLASVGVTVALALASIVGAFGLHGLRGDTAANLPLTVLAPFLSWFDPVNAKLASATGLLYVIVWIGWLGLDAVLSKLRDDPPEQRLSARARWRFVLASALAAMVAGLAMVAAREVLSVSEHTQDQFWRVLAFGPLVVYAAVVFTAIVHVGLAGHSMSDVQREVWARVGGKTGGLIVIGVTATLVVVVYGPWWLTYWVGQGKALGWSGLGAWAATSGGGLLAAYSAQVKGGEKGDSRILGLLARVAPWIFVLGLWMGVALLAQYVLSLVGWDVWPANLHKNNMPGYFDALAAQAHQHWPVTLGFMAVALAIWALLGRMVDSNEFSMNAFYRNRLVRCYLGASNVKRNPEPVTNFDVADDVRLADVTAEKRFGAQRPLYPLVTTALNLVASKQLDWQDRKAASFTLSPKYCGHLPPASRMGCMPVGDRPGETDAARRLAEQITLGTAVSVSGAAVSPNMGYHSSPAVTFLLTLFDARLGWWAPNRQAQAAAASSPSFPGRLLLAEMLGSTHERSSHVYLSDGGHFENLGLYELVRRRCRFILCVDASADSSRDFADLGSAIQKCRVDFGAHIDIDVSALRVDPARGYANRHCAVGSIVYDAQTTGVLLYVKPSLTGNEPADVLAYAREHKPFPHEPTGDQFFDEAQFESYRQLGLHSGRSALGRTLERVREIAPSSEDYSTALLAHANAREQFLLELRHYWTPPAPTINANFAKHADTMARLFATLRNTPALAVLDAQMYPAWVQIAPQGAPAADAPPRRVQIMQTQSRLPGPDEFRVCFYFCQELMQLMEIVYLDLDLERTWDHPDNRGWMNIFRHWSWVPMFRVVWVLTAATYGSRFVGFCQAQLELPRLDAVVRDSDSRILYVEDHSPPPGVDLVKHCEALADRGLINFAERGVLQARHLRERLPIDKIYVLRLHMAGVIGRDQPQVADVSLGVAALSGTKLVIFRVQDHVRRLGLGHEFMRLLLARQKVESIEVQPGAYGSAGVVGRTEAGEQTHKLRKMLQDALSFSRERNNAGLE
jgi:hypothetical protein